MYDELRAFARRQDVAAFIDNYLNETLTEESVRGVHVGIDRFWLEAWLSEWARQHSPCQWLGTRLDLRWLKTFSHVLSFDFDFRPRDWFGYCKSRGYSDGMNPIFIKFILRQPLSETKEFLLRQWQGYPLLYEYRPPCKALSIVSKVMSPGRLTSGSSIGVSTPDTEGTTGGFLRDLNTNKDYLVSCAHVLRQAGSDVYFPSPRGFGKPTRIGTVALSTLPSPQAQGAKCNRVASPNAPTLDLALAELDLSTSLNPEIPQIGPVDHLNNIAVMSPGDPVIFVGEKSGLVQAELGALCIWHEIEIDNQPHCISDLFEMTPRRPFYLNTDLAKGGDSGAWVVNVTNNLVGWDGMLLGGDGAQAYACFAENIFSEFQAHFPNLRMSLIP